MEGELQDWEVLPNSESGVVDSSELDETNQREFEGIEGDSEGMIQSDYFSLENQERYAKTTIVAASEAGDSVESDNPSWVDPGSETRFANKSSGELWSDSSSDRSDERKSGDFDAKQELGLSETVKNLVGFQGIEEMKSLDGNSAKFDDFDVKNELGSSENAKIQVGFEGFGEIQTRDKDSIGFWADSGDDALVSMKFGDDYVKQTEEGEFSSDSDGGNGSMIENKAVEVAEAKSDAKSGGEGERKSVVWWKVPFELLKYCVFRVGPVWSFSAAAMIMGFVILGRRLYKMKRKSQGLQLKVAVDDKVSYCICLNPFFIVSVVLFNEAWELNMGMCMKLYNTDIHVADPD